MKLFNTLLYTVSTVILASNLVAFEFPTLPVVDKPKIEIYLHVVKNTTNQTVSLARLKTVGTDNPFLVLKPGDEKQNIQLPLDPRTGGSQIAIIDQDGNTRYVVLFNPQGPYNTAYVQLREVGKKEPLSSFELSPEQLKSKWTIAIALNIGMNPEGRWYLQAAPAA